MLNGNLRKTQRKVGKSEEWKKERGETGKKKQEGEGG